jgi:acylphosphatase
MIVKGRVQGVGFRYFTYHTALAMNIDGWVRNLDNGDVEILASADKTTMDAFLVKVSQGPTFSRVDKIIKNESTENTGSGFSIL